MPNGVTVWTAEDVDGRGESRQGGVQAESTTEAAAASPPAPTGRPTASRLFELRDLFRIPFWLLAKPVYAFAPISFHFRFAVLTGTLKSIQAPHRKTLMEALERYLGETRRDEQRRVARHHFQFQRKARFVTVWPQTRNFAGAAAIRVEGLEYLDEALARGKGAILLTAHFGYARLIKPILRSRGRNVVLLASGLPAGRASSRAGEFVRSRLLSLPRVSSLDERCRAAIGEDLRPGLNVRPLVAVLERNEALVILADGRDGQALHRVPVSGIDVYFAPGAMSLARHSGAAVLPTFVVDDPERKGPATLRLVIHPPLDLQVTEDGNTDVEVNLERFARVWEEQMRTHPHDWHWSWVRNGVFDRPGRRPAGVTPRQWWAGETTV